MSAAISTLYRFRSSGLALMRLLALLTLIGLGVAAWLAFHATKRVPEVTFTLLSGRKLSTSELAGKVYLVNFWSTSCTACLREIPQMADLYNNFKDQGLEFIAVAMSYDAPKYVINYSQTQQLPFKVAIDDGSAAKRFGDVQLTPTTFVIGKDGRILKCYIGVPEFGELNKLLRTALAA